eukprot:5317152-Pyramimonas_sp.AAC.1
MVYIIFTRFPYWFRGLDVGWIPFAALDYDIYKTVKSRLSGLINHLLHYLLLGQRSVATGVRLADGSGGHWILRSRLACFIQDEKAHKEAKNIKGAAGNCCCGLCANISKPPERRRRRPPGYRPLLQYNVKPFGKVYGGERAK